VPESRGQELPKTITSKTYRNHHRYIFFGRSGCLLYKYLLKNGVCKKLKKILKKKSTFKSFFLEKILKYLRMARGSSGIKRKCGAGFTFVY
jgi:hypothetical protein